MTKTRELHISDVISAFQSAKQSAGMAPAMDVVRRFGAQYAGTIPPAHWSAAYHALIVLKQVHETRIPAPLAPEQVKAGWKKASFAE